MGDILGKLFPKSRQTPIRDATEPSEPAQPVASTEAGKEAEEKPTAEIPVMGHPEKVYLKALPLRVLNDVEMVKQEVKSGNILILKVSPLAEKSLDDVKEAISQLIEFTQTVGGDIARLGEERIVITPAFIRIWREKTTNPTEPVPTAA